MGMANLSSSGVSKASFSPPPSRRTAVGKLVLPALRALMGGNDTPTPGYGYSNRNSNSNSNAAGGARLSELDLDMVFS